MPNGDVIEYDASIWLAYGTESFDRFVGPGDILTPEFCRKEIHAFTLLCHVVYLHFVMSVSLMPHSMPQHGSYNATLAP